MTTSNRFSLGQEVVWESQSGGYRRTKTGVIVEVLPVGRRPDPDRFPSLHRKGGIGSSRDHESYVVETFDPTGNSSARKLYWPRAATLQPSRVTDPAVEAIKFAISTDEGIAFLRAWMHGEFDAIRREWPEAPQAVFDGAEPHNN